MPTQNRLGTPPPLVLQYQDDDPSADPHSWYWEPHAGGMVLQSGQYALKGRKINELSLSYLLWCRENQSTHHAWQEFHVAFDYYYSGLQDMVKDEYASFIVPFGKKHRGKTIRQCRDKNWFRWLLGRSNLTGNSKYTLFFAAVREWLAHPRHQEVARDIGEALTTTEYGDDLDLAMEDVDVESSEEPTSEDNAFIDDTGVSPISAPSESDGTNSGVDEQSAPITISDDEIDEISVTGGEGNTGEEEEVDGALNPVDRNDDQDESSSDSESEGESSKRLTETFVIDDLSTDDNGTYSDSGTQPETPVPSARLTRSQAKAQRQGVALQFQASSSISRPRGRKIIHSESDGSSEDDDGPLTASPSISPSRARKTIYPEPESGGSSEHDDSPLKASPSISLSGARIHSEPESEGSSEHDDGPLTTSPSISRSRGRKIILSGPASEASSANDDEPLPTLAALLKQASVPRGGRQRVPSEDDSDDEEHPPATPPQVPNFKDPTSCLSHRSDPTDSPSRGSPRSTRPNTKGQGVVRGLLTEPSCSTRRPDTATSEFDEEPLAMPASVTKVQTSAAPFSEGKNYSHHSQTMLVRRMKGKEKQKAPEQDSKKPPERRSRMRQSKSCASANETPQNAITLDSQSHSPSMTPSKPLSNKMGEASQSRRRKRDNLTRSPESSEEEAPPRKRRRQ